MAMSISLRVEQTGLSIEITGQVISGMLHKLEAEEVKMMEGLRIICSCLEVIIGLLVYIMLLFTEFTLENCAIGLQKKKDKISCVSTFISLGCIFNYPCM